MQKILRERNQTGSVMHPGRVQPFGTSIQTLTPLEVVWQHVVLTHLFDANRTLQEVSDSEHRFDTLTSKFFFDQDKKKNK